jgi:hypothetical protein
MAEAFTVDLAKCFELCPVATLAYFATVEAKGYEKSLLHLFDLQLQRLNSFEIFLFD